MRKIIMLLLIFLLIGCAKQKREPLKIEIIEPTVIIQENKSPEIREERKIETHDELLKQGSFRKREKEIWGIVEVKRVVNQTTDYKIEENIYVFFSKFKTNIEKKDLSKLRVYLTESSYPITPNDIEQGFFNLGNLQSLSENQGYLAGVEDIYPYNAVIIYNINTKQVYGIATLQYPKV